ncbi:phosphoribosyltransferase family protein [Chryseobacterium sp. T1]
MKKSFSLHKVDNDSVCPFNEDEYSKFKFGETLYAKKFANELFKGFINKYATLILEQKEIILFPSPYLSIPTASNFLCSYFKEKLNLFLFEEGKSACKEGKIYRKQTYSQDYGNMSFEERINLISNDTYYIDSNFVNDKFCVFIDDIKITGSHERTVDKILKESNIDGDFIFVYYAELINSEIHPSIENHYNYFSVKSTQDLLQIIQSKTFKFNTRIIKFILMLNDKEFEAIISKISLDQIENLFYLAISNNYHQMEEYIQNINKLKNKLLWQLTCKKDNERVSMLQNLQLD